MCLDTPIIMPEKDAVSPENAIIQLEVIEAVYGILITNKEEVAHWIADMARNRGEAFAITSVLNTRIAIAIGKGELDGSIWIPGDLLEEILSALRRGEAWR